LRAGLILFAARGAGDANGADRFFADLDRQRAARGRDIGEEELPGQRILPHILGKLARGGSERACRVGFLPGIFERVDPGGVMAQPYQDFAVPANHVHGDIVAVRLAGIDRGERDRGRDRTRQILVLQQLRIRRRGKHAGQRCSNEMMDFRHQIPPIFVMLPRDGGMAS
jgi:hypothetical protein